MKNKILSIGSVVLLKEANKRVMIIGYYPTFVNDGEEVTYDYSGCLFPEGIVDSSQSLLFNHDDIDKVFYLGLIDEEQAEFITNLKAAVLDEEISKNKKISNDDLSSTNMNNVVDQNLNMQ